jgi:TatD DNase family protein
MVPGRCIIAAVWIDTHCHLDATDFDADRDAVVAAARAAGVATIVLPAVDAGNFDRVRELAHRHRLAYALGIHPMCTGAAGDADLAALRARLEAHRDDARLVAVGEIGLDHFVAGLDREHQAGIFARLRLAREFDLPVLLRPPRGRQRPQAAARAAGAQRHRPPAAAAGSGAGAFVGLGFKLGFGGALTFSGAAHPPVAAAVPPRDRHGDRCPGHRRQWLYRTAEARAARGDDAQRLGRAAAHQRPAGLRGVAARRWPPRPARTRPRPCAGGRAPRVHR